MKRNRSSLTTLSGMTSKRARLLNTELGKNFIDASVGQSVALEMRRYGGTIVKDAPLRLPDAPSTPRVLKPPGPSTNLSRHVRENNFLKRYIRTLENMELGILPPDLAREVVVETTDRNNVACSIEKLGAKIALIDGRLSVYTREYQAARFLCAPGKQNCRLFDPDTRKWTIGCCIDFNIFRARLRHDILYKERIYTLEESGINSDLSALNFLFSDTMLGDGDEEWPMPMKNSPGPVKRRVILKKERFFQGGEL